MCNDDHRFFNENRNFKLLCKAESSIQPAKGAFDNPAPLPIPHSRIVRSDFFPLGGLSSPSDTALLLQAAIITHLSYKDKSWFCRTSTYNTAWTGMRTFSPVSRCPLPPFDAQQEHISGLRRIVANRNSYGGLHPFRPAIHKIAPNGKRSLVIVRNVVYNRNRIPW